MPWDELGIAATRDERAIRRAYAARLKATRPEDDAEGFVRLREAYEHALWLSRQPVAAPAEPEAPVGEPAAGEPAIPDSAVDDPAIADLAAGAAIAPMAGEVEPAMPTPTAKFTAAELAADDAPAVRTVFWRDTAEPPGGRLAAERLQRAAHDTTMPDEEVLQYAEQYGWLTMQPATSAAQAELLARARTRVHFIQANQAAGLIWDALAEGESRAVDRFGLIARQPRWEPLDARDLLKQVLAHRLRGHQPPQSALATAIADWADWRTAAGAPRPGIPFDALMVCLQLALIERHPQVDPGTLQLGIEALNWAAHAPELEVDALLAAAAEHGWFELERDWNGWPQEWLGNARTRVYQVCARRMLQALEDDNRSGSERERVELFMQFRAEPAWRDPAARQEMAELLVQQFHQHADWRPDLDYMTRLADWAGWLDADGNPVPSERGASQWLCRQIELAQRWRHWEQLADGTSAGSSSHDRKVMACLMDRVGPLRRRWLSLSHSFQESVRRTLAEIGEHLPELHARLPAVARDWWGQPRLSLGNGHPLAVAVACVGGLICSLRMLEGGRFGEITSIVAGVATALVVLFASSAADRAWSRLLEAGGDRWPALDHAVRQGFRPLFSLFVCFLPVMFASLLLSNVLDLSLGLLATGFLIATYGAVFTYYRLRKLPQPVPASAPSRHSAPQSAPAASSTKSSGAGSIVRWWWLIWLALALIRYIAGSH